MVMADRGFARWLRHLASGRRQLDRAFTRESLAAIQSAIAREERRHSGQLRFAVEGGLPFRNLMHGQSARARAVEFFATLGIWDTAHNNGVLVYLLLADRRVEIVADRGLQARVGNAAWEAICGEMQRRFAAGEFESGVMQGISAISDLLATHFPPREGDANELPDAPVVI
jgi:uncharacterized membrane protein YgcG